MTAIEMADFRPPLSGQWWSRSSNRAEHKRLERIRQVSSLLFVVAEPVKRGRLSR